MSHCFDIRVGSTVSYDGCLCTVIEIAGEAVVLVDGAKRTRRVRLVELLRDAMDAFGLPSEEAALTPLALIWADATEAQRDEARRKAAHIREMRTGFASGLPTLAQPHEPRPEYNPKLTTIHERRRTKAAELGVSPKTLKRWDDRFDEGEDSRAARLQEDVLDAELSPASIRAGSTCADAWSRRTCAAPSAASRPRSRSCWPESVGSTRMLSGSPQSPPLATRSSSSPVARDVRREHARAAVHRHAAASPVWTAGRDKTR